MSRFYVRPMESVRASETRKPCLKEWTEQWIIWIPVTLLIIKKEWWPQQHGLVEWQWKGFGSSKSDDPESNTLNSGSLKRSVLKTSLFLPLRGNHTWKRVREKSTFRCRARSAASSHICFESSTSTRGCPISSDSTSGSSYPGPKEVASGSG